MATRPPVPLRPPTNRIRGVCRYFSAPGGCFAGKNCKFAHVKPDEDVPEGIMTPYDEHKVCRYYKAGYCRRGASCWFKHVDIPAEGPSTSTEDGPAPETEPVEVSEEHLCAICFEKPVEYGLLEGCSHIFCRACIRSWRAPKGKSVDILIAGQNKTCPFCRTRSRFVTPSSKFLADTDPRKAQLIEAYKSHMAQLPCRYFERSPPSKRHCPFGRDCHYRHQNADGTAHVFAEGVDTLMEKYKRKRTTEALMRQSQTLAGRLEATMRAMLVGSVPGPSSSSGAVRASDFTDDVTIVVSDSDEDSDWEDEEAAMELGLGQELVFTLVQSLALASHNHASSSSSSTPPATLESFDVEVD